MFALGALGFLNPWLLVALAALPALWLLLKATPPAPGRVAFPGVRLLLGLEDPEKTPHRTPLWLLLLRMAIAAAAILAFADPMLNPRERLTGSGPVILVMDGGWASAPDWEARREAALAELDRAEQAGQPVSFHVVAAPPPADLRLAPRPAGEWRGAVEALTPAPWAPLRAAWAASFAGLTRPTDAKGAANVVFITDGLAHDDDGALARALSSLGGLRILAPEAPAGALSAPRLEEGRLVVSALRAGGGPEREALIAVFGRAPGEGEAERRLATATARFAEGEDVADAEIDLPLELRNQITRLALVEGASAGAVVLTDESQRRRRVGLAAGAAEDGGLRLVSSLHYLRTALERNAEVVEGAVPDLLAANPDAIFLADIGRIAGPERAALEAFVRDGGLLVRFAGPRLARGADLAAAGAAEAGAEDPLLPVPLRAGGRAVGGAMAWGAPQAVRDFTSESPFNGLDAPREVTVSSQILARLGPDLADKTWATLEDGTPLVTAAPLGSGRVVLFHVTANADWSSLPLSGLFVDMLRRLIALAGGGGAGEAPPADTPMRLVAGLDGFGRAAPAAGDLAPVPAARLGDSPGPEAPPGLYAGNEARLAFNLFMKPEPPRLAPEPPLAASREALGGRAERPLAAWLIALAAALFAVDLLAALRLSGRRVRLWPGAAAALLLALAAAPSADAQDRRERTVIAANETVLAHVLTGDAEVDRMAEAGLRGLSRVLTARTAVEPAAPMGVNLESDELAFFPILYWPVTERQPTPSDEAAARLNDYMRNGGMILFDTRDAHLARGGSASGPNAATLRRLVAALDLPPLTPAPADHVMTRTFYLLDRFPGRWEGGEVWLEAPRPAPEGEDDGVRLISDPNDGVSPVVIGSADWAAAWAVSESGDFLAPVGRADGFRQRELAFRFGVNIVLYALTGNYKSDQVHVPALLERLGN